MIVDGDDTLWEDNVLHERAIEQFIDYVAEPPVTPTEVGQRLNEIQMTNLPVHGYGVEAFHKNLVECLCQLKGQDRLTDPQRIRLSAICRPVREGPRPLIDGVMDTIRELHRRHVLILLTKGNTEDQRRKIDASGLAGFFRETLIVPEKSASTYRQLVSDRRLDPGETWMIGNSPRSDIRPALDAGIGAVFIPHPMTWALEIVPLPEEHPRLLVLPRIANLLEHF